MQNVEENYSKYFKIVYKYIFCLTGNKELSEEIVQEAFLVAVKDINKFEGKSKITTWLCQIAKNIWYKQLKKEKRIKKISLSEIENIAVESFEEKLYEKDEKLQLLKKIQKLDKETKKVIYLRIFGNLEYEEIAQIMNRTVSWARVVYFRGKQKLKEDKNERL